MRATVLLKPAQSNVRDESPKPTDFQIFDAAAGAELLPKSLLPYLPPHATGRAHRTRHSAHWLPLFLLPSQDSTQLQPPPHTHKIKPKTKKLWGPALL